jgi:hypothetical protein
VAVVFKTTTTTTEQHVVSKFNASTQREYLILHNTSNKAVFLKNAVGNSGAANQTVTSAAAIGENYAIIAATKSGTNGTVSVAGTATAASFANATVFNGTLAWRVGASSTAGLEVPIYGDLAEVLIASDGTDTGTRQKLEGYLAHKWGLAGSLPAGHPYKSKAPTMED